MWPLLDCIRINFWKKALIFLLFKENCRIWGKKKIKIIKERICLIKDIIMKKMDALFIPFLFSMGEKPFSVLCHSVLSNSPRVFPCEIFTVLFQ